jgi:hypothetical protein
MTLEIKLTTSGAKKAMENLERYDDNTIRAVAKAMYNESLTVMEHSQCIVPVDNNFLRNSYYVTLPDMKSKRPSVELGYGASYALIVHERTNVTFKTPGTMAKYLAIPINQARRKLAKRIAERAARDLKSQRAPTVSPKAPTTPRNRGAG